MSLPSLIVAVALAAAAAGKGDLQILYVDAANCPGPGDGTQANPFCSIQDAIDMASGGDEILVAPGAYTETIDLLGKTLALRSTGGPAVTTIDAAGAGTVVTCAKGEGPNTVLEGFTITGGNGVEAGGMYNLSSSPTVIDCVFLLNTAVKGGGMGNYGASPTLIDCVFLGNAAPAPAGLGGGLFNGGVPAPSNPMVIGCTFEGNQAVFGAGMNNESFSSPTVVDCLFQGNIADDNGGGMRNSVGFPLVVACAFAGNSGLAGAGMYSISESDFPVIQCVFEDNAGQGMFNGGSSPVIVSCLFAGNAGSGMASSGRSEPLAVNCTFSANAIGVHNFPLIGTPHPSLANCILWGDGEEIVNEGASTTVVRYSDVQGGWPGVGNLEADPLFADAANGNYRLAAGSPCIDAGDNTAIPLRSRDLDGGRRLVDDPATPDTGLPVGHKPIVDIGAYERRR